MNDTAPTLDWLAPVTLPVETLLTRYYRPEALAPLCRLCENYGANYACPPTQQDMTALLRRYACIRLYAARLALPPALPKEAVGAYFARQMRPFNRRLLACEAAEPGSLAVAPGHCTRCAQCARREGLPCRHPAQLRFSLDAFLLQIADLSAELFATEIQWYNDRPPPYLTMVGGLLTGEAHPGSR